MMHGQKNIKVRFLVPTSLLFNGYRGSYREGE